MAGIAAAFPLRAIRCPRGSLTFRQLLPLQALGNGGRRRLGRSHRGSRVLVAVCGAGASLVGAQEIVGEKRELGMRCVKH